MLELTKAELSKLLNVTTRTLTSWQSEMDFPAPERRGRENYYNATAVVEWWRNRELGRLVDSEEGLDVNEQRARLAKVQADRQLLLLARERGEAVLVEDVARVVGAQLSNVRARLLALPSKCSPLCHAADSPMEIRRVLEDAVHEALAELSEEAAAEAEEMVEDEVAH